MLKPLFNYVFWPVSFLMLASSAWGSSPSEWYDCSNIYKWSSSINFSSGNIIRDKGIAYKAKRQTRAELPDANSGVNGSWQRLGACSFSFFTTCDFNGDGIQDYAKGYGFADLVSGKSNTQIPPNQTGLMNAGELAIIYGKTLLDPADQVWDQNNLGMFAYARKEALFGTTPSVGDYNNDNFCDLAIGSPGFSLQADTGAKGTVNILYGSPNGLTIHVIGDNGRPVNPYDAQRFDQDSPNVPGAAEAGDYFGGALGTGDINGDGFDDLLIGVYGEDTVVAPDPNPVVDAGYFHIFYGSRNGIQTSQPRPVGYFQNITGAPNNEVKTNERYGSSVTAADFDHDGFADPVISAAWDGSGKVSIFRGSPSGIIAASRIDLTLDNFPSPELNRNSFGLAAYPDDFNNDGYIDLIIYYFSMTPDNQAQLADIKVLGSASGLVIP